MSSSLCSPRVESLFQSSFTEATADHLSVELDRFRFLCVDRSEASNAIFHLHHGSGDSLDLCDSIKNDRL